MTRKEQTRLRVLNGVLEHQVTVDEAAQVLGLGDLHWADHQSLLLLELVAKELGNATGTASRCFRCSFNDFTMRTNATTIRHR